MHWKGAKIVSNDRSNVAGANSRVWLDKSLVGSGGVTWHKSRRSLFFNLMRKHTMNEGVDSTAYKMAYKMVVKYSTTPGEWLIELQSSPTGM